jgi:hypothetical protein
MNELDLKKIRLQRARNALTDLTKQVEEGNLMDLITPADEKQFYEFLKAIDRYTDIMSYTLEQEKTRHPERPNTS